MLESSPSPGKPGDGQPDDVALPENDAEPSWPGNRWPRKETCALLEIRSDMDLMFRDSSSKALLWLEVARKMAELGYSRSSKKCKEKFENVYKYHKRTRDGRSGRKSNGKVYRFFEQLEALDHHSPEENSQRALGDQEIGNVILDAVPCSVHKPALDSPENSDSDDYESSSGEKKTLMRFFEKLMREVEERQETLQRKLVEALEKRESDRIAREEAWKAQELARIERENEILVQERSVAAAKDAAVLAFLKKFSEQSDGIRFPESFGKQEMTSQRVGSIPENVCSANPEKFGDKSSSRWPKNEVDALIQLRTNLDFQYRETGPKGTLWEEISAGMKNLGFCRSAKRCKEKWENINKYFKRVKESDKRKAGDSKTCPYFHQLDALYSKKTKNASDSIDSGYDPRPEELLMHMMAGQSRPESESVDRGNENVDYRMDEENGGSRDDHSMESTD